MPVLLRLPDVAQEALAELVPLLLCGEESAALTFGRLSLGSQFSPRARAELAGIAADELQHERLLQALRQALPLASDDSEIRRAARRFFVQIGRGDLGEHFARIAALDSGICALLGTLRERGSPLLTDEYLTTLLARIHRDEARHVQVSRRHARQLLGPRVAHTMATEMRARLATLVALRGGALEMLGVDTDRLLLRLRRVPRALFE